MSENKFGRSYVIRVQAPDKNILGQDEYVEIRDPLTCEFNIVRNNLASSNTANFTLYNLAEETRNKIIKDAWNIEDQRPIEFFAGYADPGDLIPRCFRGTLKRAYSVRQGSNFKTIIEAYDGIISKPDSAIKFTFPKGTPRSVAIETIIRDIDKVGKGSVTVGNKYSAVLKRAYAMAGEPLAILQQLTDGKFYIDEGNSYAIDESEVMPGELALISSENGLLGTPKRMETVVEIDMLFEPRIKPSQIIELQSETADRFNGYYKVTGITHRGTISGAVCGEAITSLTMQIYKDTVKIFDRATSEYRTVRA
jgi:hypothetical protein